MKCIADAIETGLKARRMTQKELAQKIGVTESTLSHYSYRMSNPNLLVFVKICKELRLSPNKMFKLIEEEMSENG